MDLQDSAYYIELSLSAFYKSGGINHLSCLMDLLKILWLFSAHPWGKAVLNPVSLN